MKDVSREQVGELLAAWVRFNSGSKACEEIIQSTGYQVPLLFKKEKLNRLGREVAILNIIIAMYLVNQCYDIQDAKIMIDSFVKELKKEIIPIISEGVKNFGELYSGRSDDYLQGFNSKDNILLPVSFSFLSNIGINPLADLANQIATAGNISVTLKDLNRILEEINITDLGDFPDEDDDLEEDDF